MEHSGRPNSGEIPRPPSTAASSASRRPIKGILKNKGSKASLAAATSQQSEGAVQEVPRKKSQKWDESNILATYRLSYRDYNLMKVNEPSIPHTGVQDDRKEAGSHLEINQAMTPDILAQKLATIDTSETSYQMEGLESDAENTTTSYVDHQEKQRRFEMKRKIHYSEELNIKLARQLISRDFQVEEEEGENDESLPAVNQEKTSTEESEEGPAINELPSQSRHA